MDSLRHRGSSVAPAWLLSLVASSLIAVGCFSADDEPCLVANGSGLLEDGDCVIQTCASSHDDCDDDNLNGCETVVLNDTANCGACDVTCGAGELCGDGACICGATRASGQAACEAGSVCCEGACVPPTDPSCACGDAPSCAAGELCCDDVCADTSRAPSHCGGCGVACAADQGCLDGACVDFAVFTDDEQTTSFGWDVAISGDWAAVGAPSRSNLGGDGVVHLFQRGAEGWTRHSVLEPGGESVVWDDARFGLSVDIDGDLLVVGAPFADAFPSEAGVVVAFQRDGDTWSQTHILTPDDGTPSRIGSSVALQGTRILTGGPTGDRARFFEQPENEAGLLITAQNETEDDLLFGTSVALRDDLLAIGAPADSIGVAFGAGSVHVYTPDPTTGAWTLEDRLFASDAALEDASGQALALARDTLFMASARKPLDGGPADAGAVYAFRPEGTGWSQQKLRASDVDTAPGLFGADLGSDRERLIVGAPASARAYVFEFDPEADAWIERAALDPPASGEPNRFGRSVDVDGRHAIIGGNGSVTFLLVP